MIVTNCFVCNKEILTYPSRHKLGRGKFCSIICTNLAFKGKHFSSKTEIKRGQHIGLLTEFRKEQKAWNKGINCPQVTGSKNGNWKGGKNKHSKGYIEVRVAVNRRKLEHRKIMEDYLGRELKSSEIIHHKDGNKTN